MMMHKHNYIIYCINILCYINIKCHVNMYYVITVLLLFIIYYFRLWLHGVLYSVLMFSIVDKIHFSFVWFK